MESTTATTTTSQIRVVVRIRPGAPLRAQFSRRQPTPNTESAIEAKLPGKSPLRVNDDVVVVENEAVDGSVQFAFPHVANQRDSQAKLYEKTGKLCVCVVLCVRARRQPDLIQKRHRWSRNSWTESMLHCWPMDKPARAKRSH